LPSAFFALSMLTPFLAALVYTDWACAQPPSAHAPTNRYFRFGDPFPLGFPNISKVRWDDLQKPPWNGEHRREWTISWFPKNGPFMEVEAEVPTDPGYSGLAESYYLRPEYVNEFRSCMEQAFAGYGQETNPRSGDNYWSIRGTMFGFYGSTYWTGPEYEDPDLPPAVELWLKQAAAIGALFCFLYFKWCSLLKKDRGCPTV